MAKSTCIKRTTINNIIGAAETSPGFEVLKRLSEIQTPKLSMEWLVRGVGDMILADSEKVVTVNSHNENTNINDTDTLSHLLSMIETKDKQIEEKDKQINSLLEVLKNTRVG